jgi:hypothetical protein
MSSNCGIWRCSIPMTSLPPRWSRVCKPAHLLPLGKLMQSPIPPQPGHSGPPRRPAEPLVPILKIEEGFGDPAALATWHAALSDSLSADLPHDLLGLWLYPSDGGPVLLGPEALAQDELAVPVPSPQLLQFQLDAIEQVVRRAGYQSAVALPIRFGRRDVGIVLMADLRPDRYGESEVLTLRLVTHRLAPLLGRLARQWQSGVEPRLPQAARIASVLDIVAQSAGETPTPQRFLSALSSALEPLLPHDHLELLLSDAAGARYYRLGEHVGGPLWLDPSLTIGREHLDVEALFGGRDRLLLPDVCREPGWPRGYFTVAEPAGVEPRAVVGARVPALRGSNAFLLAASIGPDLYGEGDAALLVRLASLIAPQVALLVASAGTLEREARGSPGDVSTHLADATSLLATTADLADATRRLADLAASFLPFDQVRFAIRLNDGDGVVLIKPGEKRALRDLPLLPVAGTPLGEVLEGEAAAWFTIMEGEARLIVPLRVAGQVHGALLLTAAQPAMLREAHVRPAQQLADVVAPHLELLRRAARLPPPSMPEWKQTGSE